MEEIVDPLNFSSAGDGGKKQIVHGTVGAAVREVGLAGYAACPACGFNYSEETEEKREEIKKAIEKILAELNAMKMMENVEEITEDNEEDANLKFEEKLTEKVEERMKAIERLVKAIKKGSSCMSMGMELDY